MSNNIELNQLLNRLEDAGVEEEGFSRRQWPAAERAWRLAFQQDPEGTLTKLRRVVNRCGVCWLVPA